MSRWVDAGAIADLKFTPGAAVRIGDQWIAIFRIDGQWRAIDNHCPHAGAPLCDGTLLEGKVVCYLHCWEFDLATGACDVGPQWNVRTWPVRETDGRVQIQVDG